jgi:CRP/FNR family cyclic AMP-dependent transcriptional regulator
LNLNRSRENLVTNCSLEVMLLDLVEETELLRKIPMFAKLTASKLKLLAFTSETITFEDDEVIFNTGDLADCAYVIMEGLVDILTETDSGPILAGTLEQNQLFGELALLNNVPRNSTLKARDNLRVMKISAEMFLKLLSENSELALDVLRQISAKLAKSHFHVKELQQQIQQQN